MPRTAIWLTLVPLVFLASWALNVTVGPLSKTQSDAVRFQALPDSEEMTQARRYLNLHLRIVARESDWSQAVANAVDDGDAFTLVLLKQFHEVDLSVDDAELCRRVIEQIETRRGNEPQKLQIDEIASALYRTSVADLGCNRIEREIVHWLIETLQSQSSDPAFRKKLEELRVNPPIPPNDHEQAWGRMSERIVSYIDQVLELTGPQLE